MPNTQHQNKIIGAFVSALPLGSEITVQNTTGSMIPTILPGQQLRVVRSLFEQVRISDIIAFTKGKRRNIIVHRVVDIIRKDGRIALQTKGDNVPQKDRYVIFPHDFIGIVQLPAERG